MTARPAGALRRSASRAALVGAGLLLAARAGSAQGTAARPPAPAAAPAPLGPATPPPPLDGAGLAARLRSLLDDPALVHAHVGLAVQVAETGETLFGQAERKRFTTASTTKLVVSSVALDRLGAAFRWTTRMLAGAAPRQRRLAGDLWLVGSGDPSLDESALRRLAGRLRSAGVRRIGGDVVGDDRCFDPPRWGRGWMWDDLPAGYSSGVSGLELHPARVRAFLRPGDGPGRPATLQLVDPGPSFPIRLDVRTGAPGSATRLRVLPDGDAPGSDVVLDGWIPSDADSVPLELATAGPTRYLLDRFAAVLADSGIRVDGSFRRPHPGEEPPEAAWSDSVRSDSLGAVLAEMLHPSDNTMAEALLRTLGAREGRTGSDEEGLRIETETLTDWGLDPSSYELADGSGLSRYDEMSPDALVRILRTMWRRPDFDVFRVALPAPRVSGTLHGRFEGVPARAAVIAKTGSMDAVRGLAGYVEAGDGETLVFALLLNGYGVPGETADALRDGLVEQLALYRRPIVPGWPSVRDSASGGGGAPSPSGPGATTPAHGGGRRPASSGGEP